MAHSQTKMTIQHSIQPVIGQLADTDTNDCECVITHQATNKFSIQNHTNALFAPEIGLYPVLHHMDTTVRKEY